MGIHSRARPTIASLLVSPVEMDMKIYIVLRKLWCIASFLHTEVKLTLVKIFKIPLIIYGANVDGKIDSASLNKLQLIISNCARLVYNKRKYDHNRLIQRISLEIT